MIQGVCQVHAPTPTAQPPSTATTPSSQYRVMAAMLRLRILPAPQFRRTGRPSKCSLESQGEACERSDDAYVRQQPGRDVVPKEQDVDSDNGGHKSDDVDPDGQVSSHAPRLLPGAGEARRGVCRRPPCGVGRT